MSDRNFEVVCRTSDQKELLFLFSLYFKMVNREDLAVDIDCRLRYIPIGYDSPKLSSLYQKFKHFCGPMSCVKLNGVIGEIRRRIPNLHNASPDVQSYIDLFLCYEKRPAVSSVGFSFGVDNIMRFSRACSSNALNGYRDAAVRSAYTKLKFQRHVFSHMTPVSSLKYDRMSNFMFSTSLNGSIKVWSLLPLNFGLKYPTSRFVLKGHTAHIVATQISMDNHLLASIDYFYGLVIWCLRTGQPVVSLQGDQLLNGTPVGLTLIPNLTNQHTCRVGGWIVIATEEKGLRFIRFEHRLSSNPSDFANGCCDVKLIHSHVIRLTDQVGDDCKPLAFDVCPGFGRIAVGCSDMTVRFFAFDDDEARTFPATDGRLSIGMSKPSTLLFSNTGIYLAAASRSDGGCWIWELEGDLWKGGGIEFDHQNGRCPTALAWSFDDANLVVGLASGGISVFTRYRKRLVCVRKHEGEVTCIAVCPCSAEIFATGGADGHFFVHRLFKGFSGWEVQVLHSSRMRPVAEGFSLTISRLLPNSDVEERLDVDEIDLWEMPYLGIRRPISSRTITCCAALPIAYGIGFLLGSAGGFISVLKPSDVEEPEEEASLLDEQFFHWELQREDTRDVNRRCAGLNDFLNLDSVQNTISFERTNHSDKFLLQPESVVREVFHVSSNVGFSRLPPPYLVDARGQPHCEARQKQQVPGRQEDGKPTVVLSGDDIPAVIDDIQFAMVRDFYLFSNRNPAVTIPDERKKYLLRCHWLTGGEKLISPFTYEELMSQINRVKELRTTPSNFVSLSVIGKLLGYEESAVQRRWELERRRQPQYSRKSLLPRIPRFRPLMRFHLRKRPEGTEVYFSILDRVQECRGRKNMDNHLSRIWNNLHYQRDKTKRRILQSLGKKERCRINPGEPRSSGFLTQTGILPTTWQGPDIDWLSTTKPSAAAYVPQLGDRLVYVTYGHRTYLKKAWWDGEVLGIVPDPLAKLDILQSERLPLPWEDTPNLPGYICCSVVNVAYHFVRVRLNRIRRYGKLRKPEPNLQYPEYNREGSVERFDNQPVDSFVRLVSLQLVPDPEQPYASIGDVAATQQSRSEMPGAFYVRYHNFLGGLDFLILRNLFDESMKMVWNRGDVFLLLSETMCFRGRVYEDYGIDDDSTTSTSLTISNRRDPWLGVKVNYVEDFETGRILCDDDKEGGFVDKLSPWDMHPWHSRLPISDVPQSAISSSPSSEVTLSQDRLVRLYGSGQIVRPEVFSPPSESTSSSQVCNFNQAIINTMKIIDKMRDLEAAKPFFKDVDLEFYPDYITVNPYMVDLQFIRDRLESGFYRQKAAIQYDLECIAENAKRYHKPDGVVVRNAKLVSSLAVKPLSDPSYTTEKLMTDYFQLVDLDREDTALIEEEIPVSAFIQEQINLEDDDEQEVYLEDEWEADSTESESQDDELTIDVRFVDPTEVIPPSPIEPRHPLRNLGSPTNPEVLSGQEEGSVDNEDCEWRKRCRELSFINCQHPRSESFRSPVNDDEHEIYSEPDILTTAMGEYEWEEDGTESVCHDDEPTVDVELTGANEVIPPSPIEPRHPLRNLGSPTNPEVLSGQEEGSVDNEDCEWRKRCRELFFIIYHQSRSESFRSSVDVEVYSTYLDVIANPMDLSEIGRRLLPRNHNSGYTNPQQFITDLNLIASNSRLFNTDPSLQVFADTRWLEQWIDSVAVNNISEYLEGGTCQVSATTPDENTTPRRNLRRGNLPTSRETFSVDLGEFLYEEDDNDDDGRGAVVQTSNVTLSHRPAPFFLDFVTSQSPSSPETRSRRRQGGRSRRRGSRSRSTRRGRRNRNNDDNDSEDDEVEPAHTPNPHSHRPYALRPRQRAVMNTIYVEIDDDEDE